MILETLGACHEPPRPLPHGLPCGRPWAGRAALLFRGTPPFGCDSYFAALASATSAAGCGSAKYSVT